MMALSHFAQFPWQGRLRTQAGSTEEIRRRFWRGRETAHRRECRRVITALESYTQSFPGKTRTNPGQADTNWKCRRRVDCPAPQQPTPRRLASSRGHHIAQRLEIPVRSSIGGAHDRVARDGRYAL